MPIINPDFLGLESILDTYYGVPLLGIPPSSHITSQSVKMGLLSRPHALAMDLKENLGLAAKYILNTNLAPFQLAILQMLWDKKFPALVLTRGGSKTFILGVYSALRAVLTQGSKVVLVGANFRQAKAIFEEIKTMYRKAPLFQQCCAKAPVDYPDRSFLMVGDSTITAIPLGHDGSNIRGLRATHIIADEFASIPEEVFQVVVRGFASVAKNPAQQAMDIIKDKYLKKRGIEQGLELKESANQIVISGTAFYRFNHFFRTLEKYRDIIRDRINSTVRTETGIVERVNYKDYGIIQMPYTAIPEGFMDTTQIGQAKITMHPIFFNMEYMAEFAGLTGGFFPMLDIENATAGNTLKNEDGTMLVSGGETVVNPYYGVELSADDQGTYVMGADPAREADNFAVCVIKITKNRTFRVVWADAWNRKEWGYSVRRIREIIKKFNIQRIVIDKGGGGTTIEDLLKDTKYIEKGEVPIFNIEKEEEEAQFHAGLNILEVKDFSDYTWYRASNYSLQGDIHHRRIMFPASYGDESVYSKYNFQEKEIDDCLDNIKQMKFETAQIERTIKGANREHFDLPDEQVSQSRKKGIVERKDRYSALLLAAYAARTFAGYGEWEKKIPYTPGFWLYGQ